MARARRQWLLPRQIVTILAASLPGLAEQQSPAASGQTVEEDRQTSPEASLVVRGEKREPLSSASSVARTQDVLSMGWSKTGSDALRMVPGMSITQHSGFGKAHQYYFRGFDAAHGQDIEFNVAGIPVNDVSNLHGQGYSDLHFVIPETIREIRSMPGSYRGDQGDFAVAGTMRYELGIAQPGAIVRAGAGSFGTERVFAAFRPEVMSQDTFVAFDQQSTRGFGVNREASSASLLGQTTIALAEKASLRLFFGSYFGKFQAPGVLLRDDVDRGRASYGTTYDPKQGGRSTRHQVLLEWTQKSTKQIFTLSAYAFSRGFSLRQNYTGFTFDPRSNVFRSDNTEQVQDGSVVGGKAELARRFELVSEEDRIRVGLSAQHTRMDQRQSEFENGTDQISSSILDAKVHVTSVSGHVDVDLRPLSRVRIHGGGRVDAYLFSAADQSLRNASNSAPTRAADGLRFGPKLSAEFEASKESLVVASFGEGFRSPQARSVYDGQSVEFTRATNFEIGARVHSSAKARGPQFEGSLAFFGSLLSQDVVFDERTARTEKVPGTSRTGASAEGTLRLRDRLTLSASGTYARAVFRASDARYTEGDLLPYAPQVVVRSDAQYHFVIAKIHDRPLRSSLGLSLQGILRRPLPFSQLGNDVFLADTSLRFEYGPAELRFDLTNLFDRVWYDGQYNYPANFGKVTGATLPERLVTLGQPRTLFATATLHL